MKHSKTNSDLKEGRIILNKGTRNPGGHTFTIYIEEAIFYGIITHVSNPGIRDVFRIDARTYTILESAVDARIKELGW